MSLIVDINPVPWEILEQVKARLLKNRAKKQKRQPEKGKDLRRVMQVDNGILAKQRWEEPSFIGERNRVFAVRAGGYTSNSGSGVRQMPVSYTIKINGKIIGDVNSLPPVSALKDYTSVQNNWFIWSANENDINEIISSSGINDPELEEIQTVTVIETEQPDPNETLIIELSNLTYTGLYDGLDNVFGISFTTSFYFDEEFPGRKGRGIIYSIYQNPGTVSFLLEDWK